MKNKMMALIMGIMLCAPAALAVESEVGAGITPANAFYGMDVWWDEMRVNFKLAVEDKARIRLGIAEERLSEMEVMASKNQIQNMNRAILEQQKQMRGVEELIEESTDESLKVQLQQQLQKHIVTLEQVRDNAPGEAKDGINTALDNSNRVFENNQLQIEVQNRQSISEIQSNIAAGKVSIKGGN